MIILEEDLLEKSESTPPKINGGIIKESYNTPIYSHEFNIESSYEPQMMKTP